VLVPTVLALYVFGLRGFWRWIYIAGVIIALYLNVFVAVVQSFAKIPELRSLAPTQSDPPFLFAEGGALVILILLGIIALVLFHPKRSAAA